MVQCFAEKDVLYMTNTEERRDRVRSAHWITMIHGSEPKGA